MALKKKYQNFDKLGRCFVLEFSMEAFLNIKTIKSFLPLGKDNPDRYPQSLTVDFHNKAGGHERHIALYLVKNMQYSPNPIKQYIYSTQLIQGECLASAYRLWKRQWKGPGREYCAEALVWQINDCWPVMPWAIVDYYLRPKHAYYTVKREMAPLSCGITRIVTTTPRDKYTRVHVDTTHTIEIWGSNLTLTDMTVDLVVRAFDVETGRETYNKAVKSAFLLPQNQSTEIAALAVPVKHRDADEEARTVMVAYLLDNGVQIARYVNWPEPLKYAHLAKPQYLTARLMPDARTVEISAEVPVKGVALECDDGDMVFEDNLLDVVPGEVMKVGVSGARKNTEVGVRYLGMI